MKFAEAFQRHRASERAHEDSPFGRLLRASGPAWRDNPFRYQTKWAIDQGTETTADSGKTYWPSGLYDYGFRFYSPYLGRFMNRDPIGEAGGSNLYRFVDNDPVNRRDLWGLTEICQVVGWWIEWSIVSSKGEGEIPNNYTVEVEVTPDIQCTEVDYGYIDPNSDTSDSGNHAYSSASGGTGGEGSGDSPQAQGDEAPADLLEYLRKLPCDERAKIVEATAISTTPISENTNLYREYGFLIGDAYSEFGFGLTEGNPELIMNPDTGTFWEGPVGPYGGGHSIQFTNARKALAGRKLIYDVHTHPGGSPPTWADYPISSSTSTFRGSNTIVLSNPSSYLVYSGSAYGDFETFHSTRIIEDLMEGCD